MTKIFLTAMLSLMLVTGVHSAEKPNSATQPVPGTWPNPTEWRQRHDGFVAIAKKGGVDLLFLGDSITDFWRRGATDTVNGVLPEGGGKAVWEKNFAPLKAANFGSCGEGTQHVLWRIRNGELDAIKPKLVVLTIGVNNLALLGNSSEEVAEGVQVVVQELRHRVPAAKILLLGIFPLGGDANRVALNAHIKQVNALVAKLDDGGKTVKFMDIGEKFLAADKTLKSVMPDGCHPNAKGYQIWADAILPTVRRMMDLPQLEADFHVAPDGNDSNPGTAAAPLATLAKARDAVRAKIAAGLAGDVLVLIRGGVYSQTGTLTFGPEDSGTDKFSITYAAYPGEKVVLSGGRRITGWKKGRGEVWTAEIPEVKAGTWYFRQLFVNGQRAIRARTPNVDDKTPWWSIKSSNFNQDRLAPPDAPVVLSVSGPVADYANPSDIELVYTCNNDMGRKRLASVSAADQTLTLATPNRWNPKVFKFDWSLSVPAAGKPCYLENALEMLDQPGEWYLDRKTGIVSYWPRSGEDLTKAEVIAPVAQNTLLAFIGTPDRPVLNVHVRGIHCQYVDWSPPAWGYMGLFCCNVATPGVPNPGHRFIDAAVEYSYARGCNFVEGEIAHVGGMGLCLRNGTAHNVVEGNEIADTGGGGIGAGGCNVAGGYLFAAPPPRPGEYQGYRIVNNYVHHCGTDYYGAVGIALYLARDSVVAHNLIHDTAYFGMCLAGSQDPKVPFAGNNLVERNHIYNAMKVTVDGAGIYVTMGQYDRGAIIRDNLVHDIVNKGPCGGLYIDTNNFGCHYENNVIYNVPSGRPLIVNFSDAKKNTWRDNLIETGATLPGQFVAAMEAYTGLEPAYRHSILKTEPQSCARHVLGDASEEARWSAVQFDLSAEGRGVVRVIVRDGNRDDLVRLKLHGLDGAASYSLRAYKTTLGPGQTPLLGETAPADLGTLGLAGQVPGRTVLDNGLALRLGQSRQVLWIVYQRN